jgi:hypothetical protein
MRISTILLLVAPGVVTRVIAHGYVQQLKIGNDYVQAYNPYKASEHEEFLPVDDK